MAEPVERIRTLQVRTELVRLENGHWCRTCLTSTGVRQHIAVVFDASNRMLLREDVICRRCKGVDIALEADGHDT